MASKRQTIGAPIRKISLVKYGHRETLGSLSANSHEANRQFHDLERDLRDGASEQRCGGGVRIVRKRNPE